MKFNLRVILVSVVFFVPMASQAASDRLGGMGIGYWAFGLDGDATIEGSSAEIEDSGKELTGSGYGFIVNGETRFEYWGLDMDFFVGKRSGETRLSSSETVEWDLEFLFLSVGAYLPIVETEFQSDKTLQIDGLVGLRPYMNAYSVDFNPYDPANDRSRSDYVSWIDPYVGFRLKSQFAESWGVRLYGDAGGFGIGSGSELSVLARGALEWMPNSDFSVIGGYRLFDLKSERQSGSRQTELDLRAAGPTIGVEMKFGVSSATSL